MRIGPYSRLCDLYYDRLSTARLAEMGVAENKAYMFSAVENCAPLQLIAFVGVLMNDAPECVSQERNRHVLVEQSPETKLFGVAISRC
jgi:hypothetical protein